MLWGAAKAIGSAPSTTLKNCAIESFALHARNLIDFFYTPPAKADDVVAAHFFTDPGAWDSHRPACPAALGDAKGRANKEVSHLTYGRLLVAPDKKQWPVDEIVD